MELEPLVADFKHRGRLLVLHSRRNQEPLALLHAGLAVEAAECGR